MNFDQDLCLNLCYELNPRVRCAFGNVWNKQFFLFFCEILPIVSIMKQGLSNFFCNFYRHSCSFYSFVKYFLLFHRNKEPAKLFFAFFIVMVFEMGPVC